VDACQADELCVQEPGFRAFCAPASRYAGCGTDADCAVVLGGACGVPGCDLDSGLCVVRQVPAGGACLDAEGHAGTCQGWSCQVSEATWVREVSDLGGMLRGIELEAGVELRRSGQLPLLGDFPRLLGVRVDLAASLQHLTFTPADPEAAGPVQIDAWVRLGVADEAGTVCDTGERFGATATTDAAFQPAGVEPQALELPACTLRLLDARTFAFCYGVTASTSGTLDVDQVEADIWEGDPCTQEPGAFEGVWTSTFTCTDTCGDGAGVDHELTLHLFQQGTTGAYMDSDGGRYQGSICGDVFSYAGGGPDWRECGVMTLTGPGQATKESDWFDSGASTCGGHCTDALTLDAGR